MVRGGWKALAGVRPKIRVCRTWFVVLGLERKGLLLFFRQKLMDHAIRVYGYFVITKNNVASFSLEIVD